MLTRNFCVGDQRRVRKQQFWPNSEFFSYGHILHTHIWKSTFVIMWERIFKFWTKWRIHCAQLEERELCCASADQRTTSERAAGSPAAFLTVGGMTPTAKAKAIVFRSSTTSNSQNRNMQAEKEATMMTVRRSWWEAVFDTRAELIATKTVFGASSLLQVVFNQFNCICCFN